MTKILFVAALLLSALYASSQFGSKLWIHPEASFNGDGIYTKFYFLEDRETGTRCYALASPDGHAISCVAKVGSK